MAIAFPRAEPATVTGGQIFAAFAFFPCIFLSAIGIVVSVIDFFGRSVSYRMAIGMLLISLVLPGALVLRKVMFESKYDASYAWFDQTGGPGKLNFYLHEYVSRHPTSVSFPKSDSEEISVEGFLDYVRKQDSTEMPDHSGRIRYMKIKDDGIYTEWGAKIRLAADRNHDGYIDVDGQRGCARYGFSAPDPSAVKSGFASAVFVSLPDKVLKDTTSSLVTLDTKTYERLAPIVLKNTK